MTIHQNDTIFALSTLLGKSGVAVVRVSGDLCFEIAKAFSFDSKIAHSKFFRHQLCSVSSPITFIDDCLIVYFKSPKSFTGQDVIEFHTHGSIAVIKCLLTELSNLNILGNRLRIAEPGEFSKRAFLNGKMDLTQAEGLAALIESETEVQRKIAARQMQGEQGTMYAKWRGDLIKILAFLEAFIDFPTDDIPDKALEETQIAIDVLIKKISHHLNQNNHCEILKRGISVAIIGEPNAGKSTLINAFAKRDVAIVSSFAGTTRDVIEVKLDISGFPVILYDTAGIREGSNDSIEIEGIKRSYLTLKNAKLCILVVDCNNELPIKILSYLQELNIPYLIIFNKIDLNESGTSLAVEEGLLNNLTQLINSRTITEPIDQIYTSFKNNRDDIVKVIKSLEGYLIDNYTPSDEPLITSLRHEILLEDTLIDLNSFDANYPLDISSQYVRQAANSLGQIIGKINLDEILDLIFSSFCIGK